MLLPKSNAPRWLILVIDLFIALFSLALAYIIRFDFTTDWSVWKREIHILLQALPVFIIVKFFVFFLFKTHYGIVRHTSTQDFKRVFFALSTATGIYFVFVPIRAIFFDKYNFLPISILIMEFLVCFFFMVAFRFVIKLIYLEANKPQNKDIRILVYGAGISGLITKRTIEKDTTLPYTIVGFIDDDKKKQGARLEGMTVYHTEKLLKLIHNEGVKKVIIAIQHPDPKNKSAIIDLCFENQIEVLNVPSPNSWINGNFSSKQIRKINIEDLLGREQIQLDTQKIAAELNKKVILVTGAAGSIGSGLIRQILSFSPQKIILLDQAESALYDLYNDLHRDGLSACLEVVIADIRSRMRMRKVFEAYRPHFVFHAAAYKHVPLMEENPSEALLTNIKGSKNLVDLSNEFQVYKFVMISTDKAVNPTNVMGASKRIAEIYAQYANNLGSCKFITTRFGNVLGSNGSVIPLFRKQIEKGGPITVTDERITRFFMTIPEACQLVLDAGAMGNGGEIFVFDMGKCMKIVDLAKKMIQLSGLELGKDIEIKITGLRPGEKLYEEVLAKEETTLPTHNKKIMIAHVRDIDSQTIDTIDQLINLFDQQNNQNIVATMKAIVPEFISNNSIYSKLDNIRKNEQQ
jgi:FlaA1/EpsC-like NDP-sugar epimerase